MSYLAERELNKSGPSDITQQNGDVDEGTENAKVKEEIEKTFQEDFHPAILGKANDFWVPQFCLILSNSLGFELFPRFC